MTEAERSAMVGGASRIAPRLWMGRHPAEGYVVGSAGFSDLVLCARELQPAGRCYPQVAVHRCPLRDDGTPMEETEKLGALCVGMDVARMLQSGRRVLVTCAEGRNRSGLVVALALMSAFGQTPESAIETVRAKRNPALPANRPSLVNDDFVAFIRSLRAARP